MTILLRPPLAATAAALLACGLAMAAAAWGATLHVTVTGADGKPAADTVVLVQPAAGAQAVAPAPRTVAIEQKDFRFMPYVAVVPPGGAVRFVNKDPYDHHIRTLPGGPLGNVAPVKTFEFRLAAGGRNGDTSEPVKLDLPGTILLGCHLHGSMRAHIFVTPTPWYAVTDDKGRATIEVPDGPATLALWHPDQLSEQPGAAVQVAGDGALAQALNFTPRRRPPPRTIPKGEYEQ